jgi:rod shape-determining protein MreC
VKERWNHLLLGVLLLGHLVLLSSRESSRGSLLERAILGAVGPVAHAVELGADALTDLGDSLRRARTLRADNLRLQREVDAMRQRLVALYGIEEELEQLEQLSSSPRPDAGFFVASVVYNDRVSWLRTMVIFTGSQPAAKNQPVVTAQGLVGRVIIPASRYAKVLLLTDRTAAFSAMIQRTRRRGIALGGGDSLERPGLILDNIPLQADVRVGDKVVTAGDDGIFPRGIPIGTVRSVAAGQGLVQSIEVDTAIDLGLLDLVYVLTEAVIPEEVRTQFYGGSLSTP